MRIFTKAVSKWAKNELRKSGWAWTEWVRGSLRCKGVMSKIVHGWRVGGWGGGRVKGGSEGVRESLCIECIMKTEHGTTKRQRNVHHQQSEKGTRPLEDQLIAEKIKLHIGGGGGKFMIKNTSIQRHLVAQDVLYMLLGLTMRVKEEKPNELHVNVTRRRRRQSAYCSCSLEST